VVDASQGVEAQSVANCYTAVELELEVMPVLNKIDLPAAEPDRVAEEVEEIIGIDASDALGISAKTGEKVPELLEQLVATIPAPTGNPDAPLKALVVDSWFDSYVGVVTLVRIIDGAIRKRDKMMFMSTGRSFLVDNVGVFTPKRHPTEDLHAGQVGYIIAGIKEIDQAKVGDTITLAHEPAEDALDGFREVTAKVFAGVFPVSSEDYESFRDALEKLKLNDSSLVYEPESSAALGFGTVVYEVLNKKGEVSRVQSPSELPPPNEIEELREPVIEASILVPPEYVGEVIKLCVEKRGTQTRMMYIGRQVSLGYELPMSEVVLDFYDRLKSCSRGYASFEYSFLRYEPADLVKVDILINGDLVDALAIILHRAKAQTRGRDLVEKMKDLIPRQMFEVAVQAAIGTHVIARSNVKAMRKNVLAKCYGGDVSRKKKLLEKQKAGKKRMKQI